MGERSGLVSESWSQDLPVELLVSLARLSRGKRESGARGPTRASLAYMISRFHDFPSDF